VVNANFIRLMARFDTPLKKEGGADQSVFPKKSISS
jgi:hypothetical protein